MRALTTVFLAGTTTALLCFCVPPGGAFSQTSPAVVSSVDSVLQTYLDSATAPRHPILEDTIGSLLRDDPAVLSALIQLVHHSTDPFRAEVIAHLLYRWAYDSTQVEAAFKKLAAHEDHRFRTSVPNAMPDAFEEYRFGHVPPAWYIELLSELLNGYEEDVLNPSLRVLIGFYKLPSMLSRRPPPTMLVEALRNPLTHRDIDVRTNATRLALLLGSQAERVVPQIEQQLSDSTRFGIWNSNDALRFLWIYSSRPDTVATLLIARAGSLEPSDFGAVKERVRSVPYRLRERHITALQRLLPLVQDTSNPFHSFGQEEMARETLADIQTIHRADVLGLIIAYVATPKIALPIGIALYLLALFGFWSAAVRFRPLWVLRAGHALPEGVAIRLPDALGPLAGVSIGLTHLTLLHYFRHHSLVLDAWIASQRPGARERFLSRATVLDRMAYVPVATELDGVRIPDLRGTDLRRVFQRKNTLLIYGEGGIGKTTLACQIAKWCLEDDPANWPSNVPTLPLLLENNFPLDEKGTPAALIEILRHQLEDVTGAGHIPEALFHRLLTTGRILVIADSLSERDIATRTALMPDRPGFSVRTYVITSRQRETMGGVTHSTLRSQRIDGPAIAYFLQSYFEAREAKAHFGDWELLVACADLVSLVGGRDVTPLFATIYADLLIAQQRGEIGRNRPRDLPELVLYYLNVLNRHADDPDASTRILHSDAKRIAWCILSRDFRPTAAPRPEALATLGGPQSGGRLDEYEHRLRLLETVGVGRDHIRFVLDPVAEYLAAIHAIEISGSSTAEWNSLLRRLQAQPAAEIRGFLKALSICATCPRYAPQVPSELRTFLHALPAEIFASVTPSSTSPNV